MQRWGLIISFPVDYYYINERFMDSFIYFYSLRGAHAQYNILSDDPVISILVVVLEIAITGTLVYHIIKCLKRWIVFRKHKESHIIPSTRVDTLVALLYVIPVMIILLPWTEGGRTHECVSPPPYEHGRYVHGRRRTHSTAAWCTAWGGCTLQNENQSPLRTLVNRGVTNISLGRRIDDVSHLETLDGLILSTSHPNEHLVP